MSTVPLTSNSWRSSETPARWRAAASASISTAAPAEPSRSRESVRGPFPLVGAFPYVQAPTCVGAFPGVGAFPYVRALACVGAFPGVGAFPYVRAVTCVGPFPGVRSRPNVWAPAKIRALPRVGSPARVGTLAHVGPPPGVRPFPRVRTLSSFGTLPNLGPFPVSASRAPPVSRLSSASGAPPAPSSQTWAVCAAPTAEIAHISASAPAGTGKGAIGRDRLGILEEQSPGAPLASQVGGHVNQQPILLMP